MTTRAGGDVWSYPNIHGHIAATANAAGAKTGITVIYSPDGVALDPLSFSGSDPVVVDPPDNSAGSFDYGWQGKDQRPLEHAGTLLATIEMGARQYVPSIGRFIEIDPVEGASASDYDYCLGDPINCEDLDGNIGMPKWAKSVGKGVAAVGREAWKRRDQIAFGLAVVGTFTCAVCTGAFYLGMAVSAASAGVSCARRQASSCALGVASVGLAGGGRWMQSSGRGMIFAGRAMRGVARPVGLARSGVGWGVWSAGVSTGLSSTGISGGCAIRGC